MVLDIDRRRAAPRHAPRRARSYVVALWLAGACATAPTAADPVAPPTVTATQEAADDRRPGRSTSTVGDPSAPTPAPSQTVDLLLELQAKPATVPDVRSSTAPSASDRQRGGGDADRAAGATEPRSPAMFGADAPTGAPGDAGSDEKRAEWRASPYTRGVRAANPSPDPPRRHATGDASEGLAVRDLMPRPWRQWLREHRGPVTGGAIAAFMLIALLSARATRRGG